MNYTAFLLAYHFVKRWVIKIIEGLHPTWKITKTHITEIEDNKIKLAVLVVKPIDKIDIKFKMEGK